MPPPRNLSSLVLLAACAGSSPTADRAGDRWPPVTGIADHLQASIAPRDRHRIQVAAGLRIELGTACNGCGSASIIEQGQKGA